VGAILSGLETTKRAPPSVSSHNWRDIERGMQIISPMTFTKNIGMLLLAIYLILVGLIGVFGFHFGFITGIIAFIAGIFILLGR